MTAAVETIARKPANAGGKVRVCLAFDGRTTAAKRLRATVDGLLSDLGHPPTTAERRLVESAALLSLKLQTMQAAMANGETADPLQLVAVSGALTRTLRHLGVGRDDHGHGRKRRAGGPRPLEAYLSGKVEVAT